MDLASSHPPAVREYLDELERRAYNAARRQAQHPGEAGAIGRAATQALEDLARRRRDDREGPAGPPEPAPMDDLRARLRAALDYLTDDLTAHPHGSELVFAAAHATAAAALAYTRLGGNLELAPTGPLEAELRVRDLETAIDDVRRAVTDAGTAGAELITTGRLEDVGSALETLFTVR